MLTPIDAILFKIVHTCANECLILTYIICPESLVTHDRSNRVHRLIKKPRAPGKRGFAVVASAVLLREAVLWVA